MSRHHVGIISNRNAGNVSPILFRKFLKTALTLRKISFAADILDCQLKKLRGIPFDVFRGPLYMLLRGGHQLCVTVALSHCSPVWHNYTSDENDTLTVDAVGSEPLLLREFDSVFAFLRHPDPQSAQPKVKPGCKDVTDCDTAPVT